MKKLLSLLIVICLCLSLGACGKKESKTNKTPTDNNATVQGGNASEEGEEKDGTVTTGNGGTDFPVEAPTKIEDLPADDNTKAFFTKLPKELVYSSGAGGWSTVLTINPNGTFYGEYHDSEMGVTGEGYPNGMYYRCSFSGKFSTPLPLDEHTYISSIESIDIKTTVGEITYEDGVKYENTMPYGLENAKEVVFYLPGAPKNTLSEEFLSWVTPHYNVGKTLPSGVYGMYSFNDNAGFVGKK